MCASGKQAEHKRSIHDIGGLAEKLTIDHDNGISSKYNILWMQPRNRQRLLTSQPFGTRFGGFSWLLFLRDICRLSLKQNSRVTQQFLAAGRGGGKYEH